MFFAKQAGLSWKFLTDLQLRSTPMRLHALRVLAAVFTVMLLPALSAQAKTSSRPWPIRAVIIATFEVGNDTGDTPGEYQFWVEREHLEEVVDFPGGAALPAG